MKKKITVVCLIIILLLFVISTTSNALSVEGAKLMLLNHTGAWLWGEYEIYCVDHGDKINSRAQGEPYVTTIEDSDYYNPGFYPSDPDPVRNATVYGTSEKIDLDENGNIVGIF